jgi:hypothetical protein
MVTTEPLLNELVVQLQRLRQELIEHSAAHHELQFSRSHLEQVRLAFAHMILHGEEKLHRLCQLICDSFVASYQIQSVVIGDSLSPKVFQPKIYTPPPILTWATAN